MSAETIKRNTAYKLRIGDVIIGKPTLNGERFSFLELGDKKIIRVNIVGNVIDKFSSEGEKKYSFATIDDGSGQIRIKAFGEDLTLLDNITQGQTILVIGNLRFFSNELYIAPEIVNKQHPNLLYLRQVNLLQEQGSPQQVQQDLADFDPLDASQVKEEKVSSFTESKRQKLMNAISHLDTELGASLTEVIQASGLEEQEAQAILKELLQEGEIFKISPDRIKIT